MLNHLYDMLCTVHVVCSLRCTLTLHSNVTLSTIEGIAAVAWAHMYTCPTILILLQYTIQAMIMLNTPSPEKVHNAPQTLPQTFFAVHHVMPNIVYSDILDMGIYHANPSLTFCTFLFADGECSILQQQGISSAQKPEQSSRPEPECHVQACELQRSPPGQAGCAAQLKLQSAWTWEDLHRQQLCSVFGSFIMHR